MLKIKDDFNLEELEKFGFEHTDVWRSRISVFKTNIYANVSKIIIDKKRILHFNGFDKQTIDKLYDLIKSGLVEKMEE